MIQAPFSSAIAAQPRHDTFLTTKAVVRENQENDGQTGSCAWTKQCLRKKGAGGWQSLDLRKFMAGWHSSPSQWVKRQETSVEIKQIQCVCTAVAVWLANKWQTDKQEELDQDSRESKKRTKKKGKPSYGGTRSGGRASLRGGWMDWKKKGCMGGCMQGMVPELGALVASDRLTPRTRFRLPAETSSKTPPRPRSCGRSGTEEGV